MLLGPTQVQQPLRLLPPPCYRRLQNDLQKLVEQHRDVQHAPAAPTLVRLEVRPPGRRGWGGGGEDAERLRLALKAETATHAMFQAMLL